MTSDKTSYNKSKMESVKFSKVKQCKCGGVMYAYERFCLYCGKTILYNEAIYYSEIKKL